MQSVSLSLIAYHICSSIYNGAGNVQFVHVIFAITNGCCIRYFITINVFSHCDSRTKVEQLFHELSPVPLIRK